MRLCAAVLFIVSAFVGHVPTSSAAPSKAQVEAAQQRLGELQRNLDLLVEQYDQALTRLEATRARLVDIRQAKAAADAEAARATRSLSARAVAAYTGMGSQLDAILTASNFTEFSDRVQYMGAVAQSDEDLATEADTASARARWEAQELQKTLTQEQQQKADLHARIDRIRQATTEQEALYQRLHSGYEAGLRAARQAERLAELQARQNLESSSPSGGGNYTGPPPPPSNQSAAQTAIYYARSVIGTQYVWGSADPSVGFDCSGLTMWAWSHAGVSLPHSSAAQYGVLPHVSRDQLAPGDLVFFYSPISHVGLYIGGGQMIDASHPGPGGEVAVRSVSWDSFVGAGRPG